MDNNLSGLACIFAFLRYYFCFKQTILQTCDIICIEQTRKNVLDTRPKNRFQPSSILTLFPFTLAVKTETNINSRTDARAKAFSSTNHLVCFPCLFSFPELLYNLIIPYIVAI